MIEKLKKITSTHWLLLVGILFAFIGGHWSSDSSLVSHLGLTASVVSIVLAVIAIFYTIERKSSTEEQIGRMNGILHNLELSTGRLEEKGEAMHKATESILSTQSIERSAEKKKSTEETGKSVKPPISLEEQLSSTSPMGLLLLYWIVKAKRSVKASSIKILQEKLDLSDQSANYAHGFYIGTGINSAKMDISASEDSLMAAVIPDGFEELLQKAISKKLEDTENISTPLLKRHLESADRYFDDVK